MSLPSTEAPQARQLLAPRSENPAQASTATSIRYYGRFYRTALDPLLKRVNTYLRRWAGRKYKRLRTHKRFNRWWTGLLAREPGLFAHWSVVRSYG